MPVHIDIPEEIRRHLQAEWGDLSQAAKEALALESYRAEKLSLGQVAEMLGLSVYDAEGFLKRRGVQSRYSLEDLEQDRAALKSFE